MATGWLPMAADQPPSGATLGRRLSDWWRRRGLRARLTLTATAVIAVALAGGAALGVHALAASLVKAIDGTAEQSAEGVAALVNANRLPNPVPVAGGTVTVQVLGASGRIIAASPGADRLVPLLPGRAVSTELRTGHAVQLRGGPYGLPGLLRVVAVQAALRAALDPGASTAPAAGTRGQARSLPRPGAAHVPTDQVSTVSGDCQPLRSVP